MSVLKETRFIMDKYHISANKNLGQNFLIDDETVLGIVNVATISKDDLVIEIGPGLGTLTKELLERAGQVTCIELDKRMIEILQDRFSMYNNFELINNDVLKVDLKRNNKKIKFGKYKNSSKLAVLYNNTNNNEIIRRKIRDTNNNSNDTKEVADRLITKPGTGDTGAITYAINYYSEPKRVLEVPNTAFIPEPKVNSSVIQLQILKEPKVKVEDEAKLFDLIKTAFMQKRKTLVNGLANSNKYGTKEQIEQALTNLNIDLKIRPEKLALEQFAELSKVL